MNICQDEFAKANSYNLDAKAKPAATSAFFSTLPQAMTGEKSLRAKNNLCHRKANSSNLDTSAKPAAANAFFEEKSLRAKSNLRHREANSYNLDANAKQTTQRFKIFGSSSDLFR